MNCTNHPEREAVGMCVYCGKPYCAECMVEVKGKMYCKSDLGNVLNEAKQAANTGAPTINITNSNESSNVNTNTNTNNIGIGFARMSRKSRTTALILCIIGFLGIAGLHRMYVGKVGSGVAHLFTCGWFFFGTFFDLISILTGRFKDSHGRLLA